MACRSGDDNRDTDDHGISGLLPLGEIQKEAPPLQLSPGCIEATFADPGDASSSDCCASIGGGRGPEAGPSDRGRLARSGKLPSAQAGGLPGDSKMIHEDAAKMTAVRG